MDAKTKPNISLVLAFPSTLDQTSRAARRRRRSKSNRKRGVYIQFQPGYKKALRVIGEDRRNLSSTT
jgi:hypothetical protein